MTGSLLEIRDLKTYFPYVENTFFRRARGHVKAVDGVTIDIAKGEILGLVGESGCGKSTLARTVIGLEKKTAGSIKLEGRELGALSGRDLRHLRPKFQMIFQDPYSSLNPRMTVFDALSEPLRYHGLVKKVDLVETVSSLMDEVGLMPRHMKKYPHEFSGGQLQRIAIARVLALQPKFIVADEPVSALDVSIQSQILNLLRELTGKHHLTVLFISHDLSVIRHIADRTAVMYLGKIVESGGSNQVFSETKHPYTQALLSAIPLPDPDREKNRKRILMTGDPPSALNPPSGCRFHPRCRYAESRCAEIEPKLEPKSPGHLAACLFSDRVSAV
ncbi:MAG: oligopeptide/dipeptide ABC transporter ATP-binding protein [Desulfobacterales bacterium]